MWCSLMLFSAGHGDAIAIKSEQKAMSHYVKPPWVARQPLVSHLHCTNIILRAANTPDHLWIYIDFAWKSQKIYEKIDLNPIQIHIGTSFCRKKSACGSREDFTKLTHTQNRWKLIKKHGKFIKNHILPNPQDPKSQNHRIPKSQNLRIPKSTHPQIPKSKNPKIPQSPNPKIPKFPNRKITKLPKSQNLKNHQIPNYQIPKSQKKQQIPQSQIPKT